MLNNNVTNVLSQLNNITNTVVLKFPTTIINSDAGDILVKCNIEELDSEEFPEIGIFNLSEFLSTFKLFSENRTTEISDKNIIISEGTKSVSYITSNISLLGDYNKSSDAFVKTEAVPSVAEFTFTPELIKDIKSAAGVFKDLSNLSIKSQDGVILIELKAENSFNAKSNTYKIEVEASTSKEFEISLPVDNFNSIPSSEYTAKVKYNSARDAYRLMLSSTEIDLDIILGLSK